MTSTPSSARTKESAALLLTFSIFALIEGTIRMTSNSKPSGGEIDYWATETADGTSIVPIGARLIGGVAEVIFGILGVYVSFLSLLFNWNNPMATTGFLVIQAVFGWYVFLTFVIASPIISAKNAEGTDLLSQSEQRALIILGNMLGSITFCYALQGGQFIMGLRLLAAQKGVAEAKAKNVMRAMIWAVNMFFATFSTFFVGAMLASKGFTSATAPIGLPPHVVWYPSISIITAIFMLLYSILSLVACKNEGLNKYMPTIWMVVTTAMMVNFSWTFGIVPGLAPPIPGSAQHIGLILSVTMLPLFHSQRSHYLVEDEEATLSFAAEVGKGDTIKQPPLEIHPGGQEIEAPKEAALSEADYSGGVEA